MPLVWALRVEATLLEWQPWWYCQHSVMEFLEISHRVDTALVGVTTPHSRGIIEVLAEWSSDLPPGGTVAAAACQDVVAA
jgi:hypothetical protein